MSKEIKLNLPSKIESVEKAAHEAEAFAKTAGFGDEILFSVDMAIRESVANAVKHGNKLDETKTVEITFSDAEGDFVITVRDFGNGFSVEEIPDPTNSENLLKASGRGVLFMRSFMDEVEWTNHTDGGTIVKMLKRQGESKK